MQKGCGEGLPARESSGKAGMAGAAPEEARAAHANWQQPKQTKAEAAPGAVRATGKAQEQGRAAGGRLNRRLQTGPGAATPTEVQEPRSGSLVRAGPGARGHRP